MSMLMVLRIAFKALARNKMRTALTMLGMIIGVSAVITMVALGTGAQSSIETQIQAAGTNMIMVSAGNFQQGGVRMGQGNSTTMTPAPSANTKPSRVRSNGREAPSGSSFRFDSAVMFASAAKAIASSGASDPPARATSHSPDAISRSASWYAITPDAHAATWVMTGPVRPYFVETWAAAIDPERAGIAMLVHLSHVAVTLKDTTGARSQHSTPVTTETSPA